MRMVVCGLRALEWRKRIGSEGRTVPVGDRRDIGMFSAPPWFEVGGGEGGVAERSNVMIWGRTCVSPNVVPK